jgi:hypothetical protein
LPCCSENQIPTPLLGHEFFDEITKSAVPIDRRALKVLKRSPLALDIYVWLTYRMSYLRRPSLIPWSALQGQFGAEYARLTDFRCRFLKALRLVLHVYPRARLRQSVRGLWLRPSPCHVRPTRQLSRDRLNRHGSTKVDGLSDCG